MSVVLIHLFEALKLLTIIYSSPGIANTNNGWYDGTKTSDMNALILFSEIQYDQELWSDEPNVHEGRGTAARHNTGGASRPYRRVSVLQDDSIKH